MIKTKPSIGTLLALPAFLALACASAQAGSIITQTAAPTEGTYDIAQLVAPTSDTQNIGGTGQTYTGNNDGDTYVSGGRPTQGQLFTTGSGAGAFTLNGIWVENVNYTDSLNNGTWASLNPGDSITLRIVDPSQLNTAGFVLDSQTCTVATGNGISGGNNNSPYWSGSGDWLYMSLDTPVTLAANTQYGFDLTSSGPWFELAGMNANQYDGGSAYSANAGDLNTGTVYAGDRTFVVGLTAVPEPSTLALAGLGGLAFLFRRRVKN